MCIAEGNKLEPSLILIINCFLMTANLLSLEVEFNKLLNAIKS